MMTIKKYRQLFKAYSDIEATSLSNIDTMISDPFAVVMPTAGNARQYHEDVKWAYDNVVALLGDKRIAKKLYKQFVGGNGK